MFDFRRLLPTVAPGRGRLPQMAVGVVASAALLASFGDVGPGPANHLDRRERTVFIVVDELGEPVSGAVFTYLDRTRVTGRNGAISIDLREPVAGVVSATDKLDEPVTLAPGDSGDEVVLFDRVATDGSQRVVMHFGGDVMLGRRYQEPIRPGTAVVDDVESARAVVADIAPIAGAADLTVVNVETVIGDLGADEALPGKKYLLQSPPIITDMLLELGVDAATFGNNHAYDWGQAGVDATLEAMEPTGIVHTGVGANPDDAVRGALVPAAGQLVGIVSVTSIVVDTVNDRLPDAEAEPPDDLDASEQWQYEAREFGFGETGDPGYMATRARRPGPAWRMFTNREPDMSEAQVHTMLDALLEVYPEMQDWTTQRGGGGAAVYERAAVADEIERLRSAGAANVVVQFHAGYQFAPRPSRAIQQRARHTIDDGADFVISHHPHVLQGFEWYDGHLIAYSLGNFVFDQNFHLTYPSMLLRVVVDGAGLVEARAIPMMLDDYRPVPVVGDASERIIRMLDVRSTFEGFTTRVDGLRTGEVLEAGTASTAAVRLDRHHGVVDQQRVERTMSIDVEVDRQIEVPPCRSMRVDDLPQTMEYGIDRFGWGSIDDVTADWRRRAPMHWVLRSPGGDGPTLGPGVTGGPTDDAIQITALSSESGFARTVSRLPVTKHRWWSAPGEPIDAPPRFTFEFDGRRTGGADGTVVFRAYHVSDVDPTRYPWSALVAEWEQPIGLTAADDWQRIEIPLDRLSEPPGADELPIDAVMVTFRTPRARNQEFRFDNVRLMEWRRAPDTDLEAWAEVDALRSDATTRFDATVSGCVDD